jgi:uncharacterized protein
MIFRLIIACIIVYLLFYIGKAIFSPSGRENRKFPKRPTPIAGEDLVKDPCCGTYVPVSDTIKANVDGETLYFCSRECLEKYKAERMN